MHRRVRRTVLLVGFTALVILNAAGTDTPLSPLAVPVAPAAPSLPPQAETVDAAPPRLNAAPWPDLATRAADSTSLAAAGVTVPAGANVFAARIVEGGPAPAYMLYEAGGGGSSTSFYPASSIKVLASLGALELAYTSGFTGDAIVDGGYSLAEYYDAAVRSSSNEDYDELVRIAGVDWLNEEFLPAHGYHSTRIQDAYAEGDSVAYSPPAELAEHGRAVTLPERDSREDYGCDAANCSTLAELVDSVRRVVLNDELPAEERFAIAPADVSGVQAALRGADSWIQPGVADVLGPDAEVYSKPGWTSGYDCVDVGLVDDTAGHRYLIGVSVPDDGDCTILATVAADVLSVITQLDDGNAVRPDGSLVPVVDGRMAPEK